MKGRCPASLTAVCTFLAVSACCGPPPSQASKPVEIAEMLVQRSASPASLEEMWRRADAVAVVRVLGAALAPRIPGEGRESTPPTVYTVEVEEALKRSVYLAAEGKTATVERSGGSVDEGTHIEKYVERGFPEFILGGRYLLFLTWNEHTHTLWPHDGPDSTYELVENVVRTYGHGPVARALDEQSSDEVLDKLRALSREGGH